MSVTVLHADSRDALRDMAEASVDACVCDPPYSLVSIVKRFGGENAAPAKDRDGLYKRASAGFMGKTWDTGETAFDPAFWVEVARVLKPGAHLIAFGGTRTYHRLVCAIEDAGFEIRDQLAWLFGSGFPKSHSVEKSIDRMLGAEGERMATGEAVKRMIPGADQNKQGWEKNNGREFVPHEYAPATDAARQWQGWGSALKPAHEPIVLARKPLIGTIAQNVLTHGTGALNVDACRIDSGGVTESSASAGQGAGHNEFFNGLRGIISPAHPAGRWPANVLHDGSEEVLERFPETQSGELLPHHRKSGNGLAGTGTFAIRDRTGEAASVFGDAGSAARFFYTAKADADDRLGSKHPTVKPVDLMAYLVKLVTPPGGVVLDPFAGSGTTGMACMREGFRAILIEREAEYVADIKRRIAHVRGDDAPLFTHSEGGPSP